MPVKRGFCFGFSPLSVAWDFRNYPYLLLDFRYYPCCPVLWVCSRRGSAISGVERQRRRRTEYHGIEVELRFERKGSECNTVCMVASKRDRKTKAHEAERGRSKVKGKAKRGIMSAQQPHLLIKVRK